jgi:DNA-binding transcriptional ArsR family regulator
MTDTVKNATRYVADTDDGYVQAKVGLIRKRAALAGEIEGINRQLARLTADMRAIEAALRVLEPDTDMGGLPSRRPPVQLGSFRGELARFLLTALRNASDKLTTRDLAVDVLRDRHVDPDDPSAVKLMQRRVSHSLMKLRNKGLVASEATEDNRMLRWWLAS